MKKLALHMLHPESYFTLTVQVLTYCADDAIWKQSPVQWRSGSGTTVMKCTHSQLFTGKQHALPLRSLLHNYQPEVHKRLRNYRSCYCDLTSALYSIRSYLIRTYLKIQKHLWEKHLWCESLVWHKSHLLTWRGQGLLTLLQPATRGRSR